MGNRATAKNKVQKGTKTASFLDDTRKKISSTTAKNNAADLDAFAKAYLGNVPPREYSSLTPKNLALQVRDIFDFIQKYNAKKTPVKLRVVNPEHTYHSVVETLAVNQPFLMDTIWEELRSRGLEIHHTFHPVISTKRDKSGNLTTFEPWKPAHNGHSGWTTESLIHIEFDRQAGAKQLKEIEEGLQRVLDDAYRAVQDFLPLSQKLEDLIHIFECQKKPANNREEDAAFLRWLLDGHFIFLGHRHYSLKKSGSKTVMALTPGSGLGILRKDSESSLHKPRPLEELPPNIRHYMTTPEVPVTITRALTKAPVHRRVDMDYIGIKDFDSKGNIIGEHRFLGLFSSKAYTANPWNVPIIRLKIKEVLAREAKLGQNNHNYKALVNILETYPRDEMFQISADDLHRIATGIMHLYERRKVRLFVRRSNHERLISAFVYIPRDRMSTSLRRKVEQILMEAYNGEAIESYVTMGESALGRLFIKIRSLPPEPPAVDDATVERLIIDAASLWEDALKERLVREHGEIYGLKLFNHYHRTFRAGYREHTPVSVAINDILHLEALRKGEEFSVAIHPTEASNHLRVKVFRRGAPVNLSDIMPVLENLGLYVEDEHPTRVTLEKEETLWVHGFSASVSPSLPAREITPEICATLVEALTLAWHGRLENDSLNGLILTTGLDVRRVFLLRALVSYMRQIGQKYAGEYIRTTLLRHAGITRLLADLFDARFDPSLSATTSEKKQKEHCKKLEEALKDVSVLDEDIILRTLKGVMMAIIRTNAWQRPNHTAPLAFKMRSGAVPNLQKPHPMFAIYVYATHVEGIHLRGGMIARGGLRWSDRPADYRTEILGLMKTQMTKNTVIVPVGSKGGFVIKNPPCDLKDLRTCDRDLLQKTVVSAYSTFVGSLLSVTDNIVAGKVVPPVNVRRHDGDDPYLVVAADKGTATFSDTANGIATEADFWGKGNKGFWLGDAFASGGSNGYDHKKMGITARGAWECVRHHFRTLGKNIQEEDFTVVAIGDMAGDVFGNGMLLSKHICLQAAYNHMHIFIDPTPNAAASWKERQRLFKEVKGWGDYNQKLISRGGGIFSRAAKSIPLSPEMQEMLGSRAREMTPNDLIRHLLKMEVELLWNGGIGTFVKATTENHAEVGDRANDDIRVNAPELGAKVVGEGGNLGMTQLARIQYALGGGLVNTDAIDNSAGVDCSDHEVNIKILLNLAMEKGELKEADRNKLLEAMTEEVADLVLADNYLQANVLSLCQKYAKDERDVNSRLIHNLTKSGLLDPVVEFLPNEEDLQNRNKEGKCLTRPEMSILLAYAKMDAYNAICATDIPEEKILAPWLPEYFPTPLRVKYGKKMGNHRLKREIIATLLANEIINRMGPTFLDRMRDETGRSTATITRAYIISRELFGAAALWRTVHEQDDKIPMDTQLEMLDRIRKTVEYGTFWFLRNTGANLSIATEMGHYGKLFAEIHAKLEGHITPDMQARYKQRTREWREKGLSAPLAKRFALLSTITCAPDVASIALTTKRQVTDVMDLHFHVGERLGMDELHNRARSIPVADNWQRVGMLAIIDDLYSYQKQATREVSEIRNGSLNTEQALEKWVGKRAESFRQYTQLLGEINTQPVTTHAMLNVALGHLKGMILA